VHRRAVLVHAEPDLLNVQRPETALDDDPPRPVPVTGAQRPLDRPAGWFLQGERGTELRPQRGVVPAPARPAGGRVAEHSLGDGVVPAGRARDRDAEVGELELAPAACTPCASMSSSPYRATDPICKPVSSSGPLERSTRRPTPFTSTAGDAAML